MIGGPSRDLGEIPEQAAGEVISPTARSSSTSRQRSCGSLGELANMYERHGHSGWAPALITVDKVFTVEGTVLLKNNRISSTLRQVV